MTDLVNTPHPESVIRRFWQYVDKKGPDECWVWTASRSVHGGCGQLMARPRLLKTHRIAYELHFGPVPEGCFVCHRCNNPPCCNPAHLYAGTPKQNHNDIRAAGNMFVPVAQKGEAHSLAKLTDEQVREILTSPEMGVTLARRFGVSKATISKIRKRRVWKHLSIA